MSGSGPDEGLGPREEAEGHLLDFERFRLEAAANKPKPKPKPKPKTTDEELDSRYAKGETRIVTEQARYSLAGILEMLKEEVRTRSGALEPRYRLDPEYQRRHRWSVERQSRLVESFLMNVPVPPVFLYERDLARFEVIDGRQRLTALRDFYADKFALAGLEHWPELNGRKCSELPPMVRDGMLHFGGNCPQRGGCQRGGGHNAEEDAF